MKKTLQCACPTHRSFEEHVKGCPQRRYAVTYRSLHGRHGEMRRTIRIGTWFLYSPFNLRPRLFLIVPGRRKFVWSLGCAERGRRSVSRLGAGMEIRAGRLGTFTALADR